MTLDDDQETIYANQYESKFNEYKFRIEVICTHFPEYDKDTPSRVSVDTHIGGKYIGHIELACVEQIDWLIGQLQIAKAKILEYKNDEVNIIHRSESDS